jgi:hypothetical protein
MSLLEKLTGLAEKERKLALRWWVARPESEMLLIHRQGGKKYFQLNDFWEKQDCPPIDKQVLRFAALISAIRDAGWDSVRGKGYRVAGEKQLEDLNRLREAQIVPAKRGRPGKLTSRVLGHKGLIMRLLESGLSNAAMADHLKKHCKLLISPEHLRNIIKNNLIKKPG